VDQKTSVTKWGAQHLKSIKEMIAGITCIVRATYTPRKCYGVNCCKSGYATTPMEFSFAPGGCHSLLEDAYGKYRECKRSWGTNNLSSWWTCVVGETKVYTTHIAFLIFEIIFNFSYK